MISKGMIDPPKLISSMIPFQWAILIKIMLSHLSGMIFINNSIHSGISWILLFLHHIFELPLDPFKIQMPQIIDDVIVGLTLLDYPEE
jgi:hypothetical protein